MLYFPIRRTGKEFFQKWKKDIFCSMNCYIISYAISIGMETLATIIERLLRMDEGILSVAFVNLKGETLLSNSKYHIKIGFASNNVKNDCGIWIRAAFAMVEQCSKTLGNVSTFVSFHEKGKLMVIPLKEMGVLILLLLLPSTRIEYIINKISTFVGRYKELISCESNYTEYKITPNSYWMSK